MPNNLLDAGLYKVRVTALQCLLLAMWLVCSSVVFAKSEQVAVDLRSADPTVQMQHTAAVLDGQPGSDFLEFIRMTRA